MTVEYRLTSDRSFILGDRSSETTKGDRFFILVDLSSETRKGDRSFILASRLSEKRKGDRTWLKKKKGRSHLVEKIVRAIARFF
ncbi:hypothetical protein [Microcoleus sp. CAWBG58]|uniref:hypothetical protein n=1 Tax=Microcoleus sp. CAWBG58 TaxID=2841651 RepID=UPI0025F7FEA3|nr:hypothetical protein [Microcoleus sp. CAWBG58]